jgi:hypothetical protein
MRIDIPQSSWPLTRITVILPDGTAITDESSKGTPHCDVELPEGVSEDSLFIEVAFLDNGHFVQDRATVQLPKVIEFAPPVIDDLGEGGLVGETGPAGEPGPVGDDTPDEPTTLDCGCDQKTEACDVCEPPKPAEPAAPEAPAAPAAE